jgi:hypothetical protein
MSSAQSIVSSRVVVRREGAIRGRISCGQRQLAGAISIAVSYAPVSGGQQNLLRAPGPQVVHEGGVDRIRRIRVYGGSQTSLAFVIQSSMTVGDFQSCLWPEDGASCF